MSTLMRFFLSSIALALAATLVGCSEDSVPTTDVTILISDAPVGDLEEVVITIDYVELRKNGGDVVVVDSFPNEDPDEPDTDTVTIDLLQVQGLDSVLIIEDLELEVGEYQDMRLGIIEENTDFSWVVEEGDAEKKDLKVPSEELKLGRFEVLDQGVQTFVIEFNLPRAMTYNPGPDRYILKPTGVRIVDVGAAALLAGTVDTDLFTAEPDCDEKLDADEGNVVYIYQGHGLGDLGDLFDPAIDTDAAAMLEPPYAAEIVAEDGTYLFSYLPAGNYTLAFSCAAEDDDADFDDGIPVPSPDGEDIEISLDEGEELTCDFPLDGGGCSSS